MRMRMRLERGDTWRACIVAQNNEWIGEVSCEWPAALSLLEVCDHKFNENFLQPWRAARVQVRNRWVVA